MGGAVCRVQMGLLRVVVVGVVAGGSRCGKKDEGSCGWMFVLTPKPRPVGFVSSDRTICISIFQGVGVRSLLFGAT